MAPAAGPRRRLAGQVGDILQARGQLDEALRIRKEEQLPVFERLGDIRSLLVGRANLARTLLQRGRDGDRLEAADLLQRALRSAEDLRLPDAEQIRTIMKKAGIAKQEA